ncbi:hypothetical protein [Kitasatospora sp. NPDC097643]|uniref:hypothetical protein n=1 Tax=Kitasatospora sp. NPDC097643 TaxID=3157230 RepID=UPI00332B277C
MDSGVRAMVEAVGEARRQLRENALPKTRDGGRDKVPQAEEAALLGALAALVEAAGELADGLVDRVTTLDSRTVYHKAGKRLREQATYLRADQLKVTAHTGPSA